MLNAELLLKKIPGFVPSAALPWRKRPELRPKPALPAELLSEREPGSAAAAASPRNRATRIFDIIFWRLKPSWRIPKYG